MNNEELQDILVGLTIGTIRISIMIGIALATAKEKYGVDIEKVDVDRMTAILADKLSLAEPVSVQSIMEQFMIDLAVENIK